MLQFCLIGAGRIAQVHAANIAARDDVRLHSVIDVDAAAAEKLAAQYGAKAGTDAEAAIADPQIDAVLVVSSSATHAALVTRAVQARKPVFCEKPLDLDVERATACVQAVEASGVPVFVDFNRRFDPNHAALEQAVRTGEVGAIEMICITGRDPEPPPLDYLDGSPGALFLETMVHDLDMARWLLGEEPVELFAMASCLIEPEFQSRGEFDTAVVVLRTEGGRLCQINNSWRATYGYDQRIEVLGSGGMVRSDNLRRTTVQRYDARAICGDVLPHFYTERYTEAYRLALAHFVDVVRHHEPPFITAEDGRRALILADAALRSARTGRPQPITY